MGFFPTSLCATRNWGEFYLGGTSELGTTRIVKYRLSEPRLGADGIPEDVAVLGIDEVFSASRQSPTRDVHHLLLNRGRPGHLFVRFWSRKSVHDLDVTSSALDLVADSTPDPSWPHAIVQPALDGLHGLAYSRDHLDNGFVYFFCPLGPGESGPTLAFRDTDRDGTLDDSHVLTGALYESMGFANTSRYVD